MKTRQTLILGLDIGGANTKAALLKFKDKNLISSFSYIEYFPFWEKTKEHLKILFQRIISKIIVENRLNKNDIDHIAISMTAELSDAFQTKDEGVLSIINALTSVFNDKKLHFITLENEFVQLSRAYQNPYSLAAANWVSTTLYLGYFEPKCILIDAGSTTIDLIPIFKSLPDTKGKTDIERLKYHELIYTGGLRATIPSITHYVPFRGNNLRLSFEKFALISDVHRILHNISESEYINDTADNRSKSIEDSYARLSRIICADLNMISRNELDDIAIYIYNKQKELINEEIREFSQIHDLKKYIDNENNLKFIITGLSADFLIKPVLNDLDFNIIKKYEEITKIPDCISSSAYAVAGAFYFRHLIEKNEQ